MEQKSQPSIIKDAFLAKIPENRDEWPEYYKHRMDICASCDKSTANGGLGRMGKFAARKAGAQCSICFCLLSRKCWSKNEECGLAEIGETPKWNRILMETVGGKDYFDVVNNSWRDCNLSLTEDKEGFELDFGDIEANVEHEFLLEIHPKVKLHLYTINICSCFEYRRRYLSGENEVMEFNARFNEPRVGPYGKFIEFEYLDREMKEGDEPPADSEKKVLRLFVKANIVNSNPDAQVEESTPA